MRNSKFVGILIFSVFIICSCADKYSKTDMYGNWSVSMWQEEVSGKLISNKMDMEFKADGMYAIDYGAKKEAGKYWISGEYLHTEADGKSEMSVRILNLTTDSLEFQMNRGGAMEHVILLKK